MSGNTRKPPKLSGLLKAGMITPSAGYDDTSSHPQAHDEETGNPPIPADPIAPESGRIFRKIPVALIDENIYGPRVVYTHDMILNRAEELRTQGQHDPIHLIPNPDIPGRYIIADGWTRVQACIQHGVLDELLAEIHPHLNPEQAGWFGYQQNEGRNQHTDYDRAMFFIKMIENGETASEVAIKANISKTAMSFFMAFRDLPEDLLLIVREHPVKFGSTAAYYLSKLYKHAGAKKAVAIALRFSEGEHPIRWLVNQVQSITTPLTSKQATTKKTIRYANGYLKERVDGFELVISVPDDKREAFSTALETLLDTVAMPIKIDPPT
jgi:ParB family chromosome partitioning protein